MTLDFETTDGTVLVSDPNDTTSDIRWQNVRDTRYEGLNRAQRRKAMSVENRAFRKRMKKRA
jgi:hypothetical protein